MFSGSVYKTDQTSKEFISNSKEIPYSNKLEKIIKETVSSTAPDSHRIIMALESAPQYDTLHLNNINCAAAALRKGVSKVQSIHQLTNKNMHNYNDTSMNTDVLIYLETLNKLKSGCFKAQHYTNPERR